MFKPVVGRVPGLYDTTAASMESALFCEDVTRTQQHQADETDINLIVKRFGVTGLLPQNVRVPLNEQFGEIFDFQSAMNVMRDATASFMQMSADVRARFGNNPAKFVDFCSDASNIEEMRKMGLAVAAKVVEEPKPIRVIMDTPPDEEEVVPKRKR